MSAAMTTPSPFLAWHAEAMRLAYEYADQQADYLFEQDQGTRASDLSHYATLRDAARAALSAHLLAVQPLIAAECATIAQHTVCDTHLPTGVRIYGTAAAKAIRERFGLIPAAP